METCRHPRTVFVAVAVIGFIQIVSIGTLLLHFSGYITQIDPGTELKNNSEATISEAVKSERLTHHARPHRQNTPAAHLPIKPFIQTHRDVYTTIIHWNSDQGHLSHFGYRDGRILVQKSGLYYIYSKTCFRHYESLETDTGFGPGFKSNRQLVTPSDGGVQLIQYVHHERLSRSAPWRSSVLMKTGSTRTWRRGGYHMCCQQQGGMFVLQAGDGVYVSVSNSWMLDPEAEGSYFGAFRISK